MSEKKHEIILERLNSLDSTIEKLESCISILVNGNEDGSLDKKGENTSSSSLAQFLDRTPDTIVYLEGRVQGIKDTIEDLVNISDG